MALKIPAKRIFGDNFDPGKQMLHGLTTALWVKFGGIGRGFIEDYNCSELFVFKKRILLCSPDW